MVRYELLDDTIAAISSPPGRSRRGIVRVSGPNAFAVAAHAFAADDDRPIGDRTNGACVSGAIRFVDLDGEAPGMAVVFQAPRTYTGQDLVELHLTGAPPMLAMLLEAVLGFGARHAGPGEFTARAYLNGRLDLTEAEAVATLVQARSDAELRAADRMLHGTLSTEAADIRERVADLLALVEAEIDFAEEPIDFISPTELRRRAAEVVLDIRSLLDNAARTERLDELPKILLVGAANAGKSTLLNRLTGVPRAICSPWPGTTRDLLAAPLLLDGHEAVLIDSAGLLDADEPIDRAAVQSTLAAIGRVDVVCQVIDSSCTRSVTAPAFGGGRSMAWVTVLNKIDMGLASPMPTAASPGLASVVPRGPVCRVSALTGEGCEEFRRVLGGLIHGEPAPEVEGALPLTARQRQSLAATAEGLERVVAISAEPANVADVAELAAFELREAVSEIGRIAGDVTTEDLLSRVFGRFCIGK